MHTDSRGGHNRKQINQDFFKTWTPNMAYVLGLIFADGAIEDTRSSSRTCYIQFTSVDYSLLSDIRTVLSSNHNIYKRKERHNVFPGGKTYLCQEEYVLRIGNKSIYNDLRSLGVTPRKSLTLKFPMVPKKLLGHFVRGYLDGDGCIFVSIEKGRQRLTIATIFTCGSKMFLESLNQLLHKRSDSKIKNIIHGDRAYQLRYRKHDSIKVLKFLYTDVDKSINLKRKYDKYINFITTEAANNTP